MTDDLPEAGRQTVQVLLDLVSVFDPDLGDDPANAEAINLAVQRLSDIGAVAVELDEDADELTIDLSGLIGGTAVLVAWLVRQLELEAKTSREDVISTARQSIDHEL